MNLKISSVEFYYDAVKVLSEISFEAESGEFIGLVGPNGSGKTTLLKIICGLLRPRRGAVYLDFRKVSEMSPRELAKEVAAVHQSVGIDFNFTVFDIVMMGRHPHLGRLSFEKEVDEERVKLWMKLTNTLHLADRLITEISGGERQRVLIARALAQEPKVLLLDEPTANLDICYQIEIMNLLRNLTKNLGLTIICAIHDLNLAVKYSDKVILLNQGKIEKIGKPREVLTEESIKKVFGVRVKVRYDSELKRILIIPVSPVFQRPALPIEAENSLKAHGKQ